MARLVPIFLAASVIPACAGDPSGGPVAVVNVTLTEGSLILDHQTVASGPVTFEITNQGASVHEFEVFATDLTTLDVVQNVADTSGLDQVDEAEDIIPGSSVSLEVDLGPGHYLVLSNYPGEYEAGMVGELIVTG